MDNGFSDGSAEMARSEFGVRVIANAANWASARPTTRPSPRRAAEFIALLNNDAEAAPDFLANLRRAFDQAPDIGMAAAKVLVWEDPRRIDRIDHIDKVGHLIYPDGQNRGRGTGEIDAGQYDRVEDCLWPDGCAGMYRKTMLDAIGGFDEDFFMFADDAELGLRGRIAGWRCLYMPGAVVRHRRGASIDAGSAKRIFLIERNRVLLAAKLFPWSLLVLNPYYFALRLSERPGGGGRRERRDGALPGSRQQAAAGMDHPGRGSGGGAPAAAHVPQTPRSAAHRQTDTRGNPPPDPRKSHSRAGAGGEIQLVQLCGLAVGQAIVLRGLSNSSTVPRRQTTIVCATPGTGTVQLIHGHCTSSSEGVAPQSPTPTPPAPRFVVQYESQFEVGRLAPYSSGGPMDKPAQNIQDSFLNNARKDKIVLTIYLMSGVKLSGRIKSFDKYSLVLETNNQEQLIFKHAISTVVTLKTVHTYASSPQAAAPAPEPVAQAATTEA